MFERLLRISVCLLVGMLLTASLPASGSAEDGLIRVLFLGDNGHHQPHERYRQLAPVFRARGIEVVFTDQVDDLNSQTLGGYDALLLYANIDEISKAQSEALLQFVEQGGGFVPVHCASYCFRNSPEIINLIGAQFLRHGTGVFRTELVTDTNHPILKDFEGFESWDETYVHEKHNERDRTVLEYRVDAEGREPWTWVREHGAGRVFYTAWGHDHRTWGNPGFQNLLERGVRWSVGDDPSAAGPYMADQAFPVPQMTDPRTDVQPFDYVDVGEKIPHYVPGDKWGEQATPFHLMQKPLPPEESLKHIVTPQGFHAELFVSEPELEGKPIAMAWDEQGRLWVAETLDYPNELQPQGQGRDRIRIIEDTDGDFRADTSYVFAEKLSIPTSITFSNGGAIVQAGRETLFLRDTDGDNRADETRVLFSGWAMNDTHGGVSNFQYGLDNWIWAMQGYNNSRPVVDGKRQQGFRQGFFRFRPDGSALEFIRSTDNNTWGLGISEEGIIFGSTANRNPSVYMPIPNRYYEAVRGWTPSLTLETIADTYLFRAITDRVRQVDQFGGYTAGAGHALYTARTYPREYWNKTAFVTEPTGHIVGTFVLSRDGASFRSTSPFNLMASDDEWTSPIMAEVGPDGNVWVCDWYNFIVQHNPTPINFETGKGNAYETDLRDKQHGRIYRIVYDESPRATKFSLADASTKELVAALRHPTMLWRKHAQRLLIENGLKNAEDVLAPLIRNTSVDEIGLNVGAIHALWTLHGLGLLDGHSSQANELVYEALRHPSAGVRRAAVQVLPPTNDSVAQLAACGALHDPDAQVRLAAMLALADLPKTDDAGATIVSALDNPSNATDRWIVDAATSAAAANSEAYLQALAAADSSSSESLKVAQIVANHYARGAPDESAKNLLTTLADSRPEVVEAVIIGLVAGWPEEEPLALDEDTEAALESLVKIVPSQSRGALLRLATLWGSERLERYVDEIASELLEQLEDGELEESQRVDAARELASLAPANDELLEQMLDLISPRLPPTVAAGILRALDVSESPQVAAQIAESIPSYTPEVRSVAITLLLSRAEWTSNLLDAIDQGTITLPDLSLDQKQALNTYPEQSIRKRAAKLLERGGALPSADRQKVLEELLPVVEQKGDVAAGKLVFKEFCAKCHMHSGEGARIGPDLTGMAVHPKRELLTQVLDPNRSVEGNFRVYTVVTGDGLVLTGLLAAESKTTVELIDAEAKRHALLREDIEELVGSPKSLMPEGFEKQLQRQQFVDLLEFLTARGRYVPLDLSKVATVPSDRGMFFNPEGEMERLVFSDWETKEFQGVPFQLIDPQQGRRANTILLHGPQGRVPPTMPKQVSLPCNMPAKAIHLLSGVSGWGFPFGEKNSVSMIVRLHYSDGQTEDHPLRNGEHFADYIRRVDVPGSQFAFDLGGRQIRYLSVQPERSESIESIDLVKGEDGTAPLVMAITVETVQ